MIRWSRIYDPFLWVVFFGNTRKLRALPVDLAAIRPGERVLDVGCGTGDVALAAARRVGPSGAVYGIDASPEMIEAARRKVQRSGRAVRFEVQPVEGMTFADGSFDVVLSSLMMHHLPGDLKRRGLAEIRRVLRPGGRLVIVDWEPTAKPPHLWEPGGLPARIHRKRATPHSHAATGHAAQPQSANTVLADLLRELGFGGIETGPTRYNWIGYTRCRVPS